MTGINFTSTSISSWVQAVDPALSFKEAEIKSKNASADSHNPFGDRKFKLKWIRDVYDERVNREKEIAKTYFFCHKYFRLIDDSHELVEWPTPQWARMRREAQDLLNKPIPFLENIRIWDITHFSHERITINRLDEDELEFVYDSYEFKEMETCNKFKEFLHDFGFNWTVSYPMNSRDGHTEIKIKGRQKVIQLVTHLVALQQFEPFFIDLIKATSFKDHMRTVPHEMCPLFHEKEISENLKEEEEAMKKVKVLLDPTIQLKKLEALNWKQGIPKENYWFEWEKEIEKAKEEDKGYRKEQSKEADKVKEKNTKYDQQHAKGIDIPQRAKQKTIGAFS